ncbi:MAG: transglutaminase family protein [Marinibacterium sp.]
MSVLYDIRLNIRYDYTPPAGTLRTLLRILPAPGPGQRLISGAVSVDPAPDYRADGHDFFGNATSEIAFDRSLDAVVFTFAGRVERMHDDDALDLSCPLDALPAEVAEIRSLAPESPQHFLGRSPRIGHTPDIAAFARDHVDPGQSALQAVECLARALHAEIAFDADATHAETTPQEAFRARRGVCQDISQIMIAGLRALGVPAGYVSGFLRTIPPEGQARLEGADAMHAWVRAWCGGEMGWVDIDPTNNIRAGEDHVTVAVGRDYSDATPVRGALRSSGAQQASHSVDVVAV